MEPRIANFGWEMGKIRDQQLGSTDTQDGTTKKNLGNQKQLKRNKGKGTNYVFGTALTT